MVPMLVRVVRLSNFPKSNPTGLADPRQCEVGRDMKGMSLMCDSLYDTCVIHQHVL